MAQNITLLGASYSDVPSVLLPKTGGGTASFVDVTDTTAAASDVASGKYFFNASGVLTLGTASGGGGGGAVTQDQDGYLVLSDQGGGGGGGDNWSWMGKNPTKVKSWAETSTFRDLGADSWTWATSTTTLRAIGYYTPSTSMTFNLEDYDYYILQNVYVHYDYGEWEPKNAIVANANIIREVLFGTIGNLNAAQTGTPNASSGAYPSPSGGQYYYYNNASGVLTFYTNSTQYGLSSGNSIASDIVDGSTTSPTWTLKTPQINIRGHNTYFSSTAYSNIDFDESYYQLTCEVWRVDRGTEQYSQSYDELAQILNNGLGVTS